MTVVEGGYNAWWTVFCSFYHHAFVSSAVYGLSVYYGSWVEDFDTGRGITSWVLTLSMAISMGTGPLVSGLCNRFGYRLVIIIGSVICAVGFFLTSFVTSVYAVIILLGGLCGFGLGLQYLPSLAIIPFYFHKRRSLAIGIAVSGAGVGVFLYPPFLIWLEEQYTWRGAMLILSGICLNMVVCGALIRPVDENVGKSAALDIPECISSEEISSPWNIHAEKTYDHNPQQCNVSTINNSLQHLGTPVTKDTLKMPNFSSVHEIRGSRNGSTRLLGSGHIASSGHFTNSSHIMDEAGSYRSLGRSHVDIYLSSSIFNLDKADRKRDDSLRQLHRLGSGGSKTSRPPSHLDSLLQLDPEHCQNSQYPPDSVTHKTSLRQSSELPMSFSCCPKLPSKYIDILKNPYFMALSVCYVLICFTSLVPVVYIVDRAVENGVDKAEAALAFSMYGAGNVFGRVALGILADYALSSIALGAVCHMVSGVATCLSPLCGSNVVLHGLYGFTFGTCIGGSVTLTPLILVDLLGLDMVNRSFGLLLVFHAAGFVLGTPMAGWIFDTTNSYTVSFIIHGAVVIIAAIIFIIIEIALVRSRRRATAAAAAAVTDSAIITEPALDSDDDDYHDDGDDDHGNQIREVYEDADNDDDDALSVIDSDNDEPSVACSGVAIYVNDRCKDDS